jgi:hypothetical protein
LLFSYIFCGMLLIGDNLISRTSRWFFNSRLFYLVSNLNFYLIYHHFWHDRLVWSPFS